MMKKLLKNGMLTKLEAEKIIKTNNSIIGYVDGIKVFALRGVKDFSVFQLADGQEWDIDEEVANANYLLELEYRLSLLELGV